KAYQKDGFQLSPDAMERLTRHRYPGNVRELENIIKRTIVLSDPDLTKASFPSPTAFDAVTGSANGSNPHAVFLKDVARKAAATAEREAILKMLQHTGWSRVRTAKLLNISYRS